MQKFKIDEIKIMVLDSLGVLNKKYPLQNYITNTVSGTQGWVIREDNDFYIFQLWFGETRDYNNTLYGAVTNFSKPIKSAWTYLLSNEVSFLNIGCDASPNGIVEIQMTLKKQFFEI